MIGGYKKIFLDKLKKELQDNKYIKVPQGYLVICSNRVEKGYVTTKGLASCVALVIRSKVFTSLCHYDGEKRKMLKKKKC
jgi:hypothetical protein